MRTSAIALLAWFAVGCGPTGDPDTVTLDTRPTKRSEVLPVADDVTNSIVVFGGNDGPIVNQVPRGRFLDETWVFEPGRGWSEVPGDTRPKARGRYAVAHDPIGRRMLLFGGRFRRPNQDGDYRLFGDLWSFDLDARTWTELDAGARGGPDPRYYPVAAWDDVAGTLYVWGGATNANALAIEPSDELWAWTADEGWTLVPTTGDAPSTRVFVGATHDTQRNRLVVFGGQPGDFVSQAFQDAYALDLTTFTWELLNDGAGRAPSTRMHAHLAYDGPRDRYLLFGGHTDIGDANDLWSMDPTSGGWTAVDKADRFTGAPLGCAGNPAEVPADYVDQDVSAPERRHRGVFALMDDSAWLFGGIHAECSDQLDDTWRYDLVDGGWTELMASRTGESCLRRGDDCACLCL